MKKIYSTLAAGFVLASSASANLVAFWDFNDGFDVGSGAVQIVHAASSGTGTLYQQRADIDGNGKGGNAFIDAANSINASAGQSMAWDDIAKSGDNDAEFFLTFSTLGLSNIVVSFDLYGRADAPVVSFDVKYDTNALVDAVNPGAVVGTIKDFDSSLSTEFLNNQSVPAGTNDPSFQRVVVDFSSATALNNQSFVAIRFDDFDRDTGNNSMRIDNVMVTAVPEPSAFAALAGVIALGLVALRRRR